MSKKVKKWILNHKKEIIIGTVLTAGAGFLYYKYGIKPINDRIKIHEEEGKVILDTLENAMNTKSDIPIEISIGKIDDMWSDEFGTNLLINDITISDIGKVGEELMNALDSISEDTKVTSMIGLLYENNRINNNLPDVSNTSSLISF